MRGTLGATLAVCVMALAPGAAQAQFGGFSGLPEVSLTTGDYQALAATYQPMLDDDSILIGTTRDWSNAETGNGGTVELVKRFTAVSQGATLPCRTLRYHIIVKGNADPYNVRLNRCKTATGIWKIY